jgi:hypothetical protein
MTKEGVLMNEQKSRFLKTAEMLDRHLTRIKVNERTSTPRPERFDKLVRWFVPNGGTLLLVIVLILTQQVWAKPLLNAPNAPGPSATTINYQGRLADSGGTPLDGNYGMTFALWDAVSGGNLVWGPESHAAVPVSDGLFSVGLGSQTAGGIPIETWDGDRYLEIAVGGETLSPRELIRSVPIAGMALTVPDGVITNQKLALSYWQGSPAGSVAISPGCSPPHEIVSLNVDFAADGVYLLLANVISTADENNGRVRIEIWDQSGIIGQARTYSTHPVAGTQGAQESTIATMVSFPAGTNTMKLMACVVTGSGADVLSASKLIVIPFGQP